MSLFEFIVGMISVLIALAVVQLLVGLGRLVQARGEVKLYLPHMLWNASVFLMLFLHWWSLWSFRDLEWNSAMFFFSLMGPTLIFFATTLLNPTSEGDETIDLKNHFNSIRVIFLMVMVFTMTLISLDGPLFGTEDPFNHLRAVQVTLIACMIVGIFSARPAVQIITSGLFVSGMIAGSIIRFMPGALN